MHELSLHHGAAQHLAAEFYNDNDEDETTHVQYFSEANGGEMRASYHGYPTGYAQIIYHPTSAWTIPMQIIDTWHRQGQAHGEHLSLALSAPAESLVVSISKSSFESLHLRLAYAYAL